MAVLWWALLWCHHAQHFLHANQDFQSPSWSNSIDEWTPTPTPPPAITSSPSLPSPSVFSSSPSIPNIYPTYPEFTQSSFSPSSTTSIPPTSPEPTILVPDQPDEEGKKAALQFLYSGDLLFLSEANCTKRYEITDLQGSPPESLFHHTRRPLDYLLHATNFLNMIFQASDMRESSIREDMEWYHALVRSLAGGDPHIRRAMLSFTAHPMSYKPQLLLQATKDGHEILLQDLTSSLHRIRHKLDYSLWSRFQANPSLTKAILLNDLQSLETPKWSRGDSYTVDPNQVQWSKPFLECEGGHFSQGWMISLSTAFYGLKPDLSPEFKGTLRVDVRLMSLGIDQCAQGPVWFANTHNCDENSTQCISDERDGSILGRYRCVCQPGYYRTKTHGLDNSYPGITACMPCTRGCNTCVDDSPCVVVEDWSLRVTVLSLQATGMLAVLLSMLVSYNFRESKRIRASGLILLETILFGALLLYFPVFIVYFKPGVFRCIALRWVRILGFCIVYGTLVLKLYRVMKVFLSRTAQRVPYLTSVRLLCMLGVMVMVCIWFLVGWTVGILENMQRGVSAVIRSQTQEGLIFYTCDYDRWDYMMSIAELLFLFWGSYLCYGARTVPSAFHEPRYMGLAIHNEMLISTAFHILRFIMVPSLHPDWTLLLFFIHTHGTVTMTLTLLFVPKFLHAGAPHREEIAAEVYEDELDLRRSRSNLNSSITSAWSEHSLDPDDIRDELKKLYAQLEVHKTKKMTLNNPHLQKKRSSRRGLGRSIIRRITEIPDSVSKQCGREEREGSPGSTSGQRRRQQDSGSVKLREESLRQRVLSLRKSHSTYDHMQETKDAGATSPRLESSTRDASLRDSLMRRNLARNVSLRSRGDSLRQAPLVCKSLSAHNLLADKKPLAVPAGTLQKSHSMMGSSRGKGPLTDAATEKTMEGSRNPLLGGSFDRAEVCPWELQELPISSENRSQKHVTYAPGKSSSVDSSHALGKSHASRGKKGDVGGKHHSLGSGEEPRSPEEDLQQSGQSETGTEVSSLASPVTSSHAMQHAEHADNSVSTVPVPGLDTATIAVKKPDSVESTRPPYKNTLKSIVLAVRAFKGTAAAREAREKKLATEETVDAKRQLLEDICPWEVQTNSIKDKKLMPAPQNVTDKGSVCSSPQIDKQIDTTREKEEKQSTPNTSMHASPGRRLERMSQLREAVCPWESMEGEKNISYKSNSVESKRSEICPWESTDSEGAGGPLSQSGSNLSFHSPPVDGKKVQNNNVWESEEKRKELCPWEEVEMEGLSGRSLTMKLEALGRQRDAVCPWESEESGSPGTLSQSQSKTFDTCPIQSKTSDSLDLEARRGEICPWESLDSEGTPATMSQSQSHSWEPPPKEVEATATWEPSNSSKPSGCTLYKSQSKQDSLCSWTSEDPRPLTKTISKSEGGLYSSEPTTKHDNRRYHYSLVEKSKRCAEQHESSIKHTKDINKCNTEDRGVENTNKLAEVCPWEVQEDVKETQVKANNSDVCPWDFQ
ncbi:probable G-protein coupled receptor 179 [Hyperolius riggenbachi]|uniref:probable G-protein coupled receptor 179 n=1 Tax=Hyperolius riggenbachi TaxID=752182 RepID=UPI0035A34A79